ncbi:MAG TPA: alpha/beta fold hydrolase [Xanthobacteraceae bacterium]|jgi:3-oxoadipate enol-lactonase
MPFFVSRGQKLHYEVVGHGKPLVLLHGVTNYGMAWTPQLSRLLYEGYRVVVPDLAGHGMSQLAANKTTVRELAADVAELLDDLSEPSAALCGLSLGGMVAQQFACDYPGRATALVIANSRPNANTPELVRAVEGWSALLTQPNGPQRRLEAVWPKLVNAPFRQTEAGAQTYREWHRVAAGLSGQSLCNVAIGFTEFDAREGLAKLEVPSLVIAGEFDELFPADISRQSADLIPGAEFSVIAGAGHISNVDSAEAFTLLSTAFLARALVR